MEEIHFADGFDAPDRLAFGLGATQLAVVAGAVLTGYALVRSPLPSPVAVPPALTLVAIAAALGWVRIGGRPGLDWAIAAARYAARSRTGSYLLARQAAPIIPLYRGADAPPPAPAPSPAIESGESGPPLRSGGARRVTFFSLKGGTGRSTLATELACLLAATAPSSGSSKALRTALLDLDLRSASVAVRLGMPHPTLLEYALAPPDERRLLDFMLTHKSGARVMLGPSRPISGDWPVNPALLREMLRERDMEGFEVVIIDLSPELSPLTIAALTSADDVFVVMTPTAGGIQDAYRTTASLRELGLRHQLRYVVNRARPDTDVAEPMADLHGQLLAEIPDDDSVIVAENQHRLVALEGSGPAADALSRLARRIGRELQFPCAS